MNRIIDLRSDTVTVPDEPLRRAMYEAEVETRIIVYSGPNRQVIPGHSATPFRGNPPPHSGANRHRWNE